MIRPYIWARHTVQCLVTALFCWLPFMNGQETLWLSGSLFAFDFAGIPFADPVFMVQGALGALVSGVEPGARIVLGGLLALLVALMLGRVFCSWLCPYGLFSEMIAAVRTVPDGRAGRLQKRAFATRVLLLLHGLGFVLVASHPLLSLISLPGQMSLLPQAVLEWTKHPEYAASLLGLAGIPAGALLLELVTGKRLWCRYLCPQSVLLGLAARCLPAAVPGLRLAWSASRCTCKGKAPCQAACRLGCNPRKIERRDCTHCGDCVKICDKHGRALQLTLGG